MENTYSICVLIFCDDSEASRVSDLLCSFFFSPLNPFKCLIIAGLNCECISMTLLNQNNSRFNVTIYNK